MARWRVYSASKRKEALQSSSRQVYLLRSGIAVKELEVDCHHKLKVSIVLGWAGWQETGELRPRDVPCWISSRTKVAPGPGLQLNSRFPTVVANGHAASHHKQKHGVHLLYVYQCPLRVLLVRDPHMAYELEVSTISNGEAKHRS